MPVNAGKKPAVFKLTLTATGPGGKTRAETTVTVEPRAPGEEFQVAVPGGPVFTALLPEDSVATYRWQPGASSVESWLTTPGNAEASEAGPEELTGVEPQAPIPFTTRSSSLPEISVEPSSNSLQELTGFGGAMTESAAEVIDDSPKTTTILGLLFGSPASGDAGLSIARVPIGPSDFTAKPELAAEEPTFTGATAEELTVPVLGLAKEINPSLKLLAAPWSAPPGFKVDDVKPGLSLAAKLLCKGRNDYLQGDKFAAYAKYLATAASYYASQKLPLWMLSLQNEPRNCNATYPTMRLEPAEEAELAGDVHGDLHGLADPPELLGWDHNWAEGTCSKSPTPTTYPEELFGLSPPIQALGFHGYCGNPSAPGGAAAGVPFYLTESTGEGGHPSASENLWREVQHYLIDPLRVGARGSLYWNLALNENCGPQYAGSGPEMEYPDGRETCKKPTKKPAYGGCIACRPFITVDANGDYRVNQDYYYWAQLSRFFPPGARVVPSSTVEISKGEALDSVAARYPDGTVVLTVLNGANPGAIPDEPYEGEPAYTIEMVQRMAGTTAFTRSQVQGAPGETVEYETVVTNTGNVPLKFTGFEDSNCDAGTITGGPGSSSVAAGESTTYRCSFVLPTELGEYGNVAIITGAPVGWSTLITEESNVVEAFDE
ncbi:MAG TPA: hypothetical protein VMB51_01540 [Solirubrobacteraceae bacterium]|nr:hypothetical protein [Solirubrobacteraceae bacterium]